MSTQTVIESPVEKDMRQAGVTAQEASHDRPQNSPVSAQACYAGFWRRVGAFFIDYVFTATPAWVGITALSVAMGRTGYLLACILSTVGCWLYFALFESSSKQATLGKLVLGIKVTDLHGSRASFARVTGRHFAKIVSGLTLCVGYVIAGFTPKKQALHDMIAGCFVVRRQANLTA